MKDQTAYRFKVRALVVFVFFILCLGSIAVRACQMQVLKRDKSLKLAQQQYYCKKISLAPHRGTIYDANGRELAVSIMVNSLYAQPARMQDKRNVAAKLAPILRMDVSKLYEHLSSQKPFVWLQRKINPTQQRQIQALNIEGMGFIPESRRFYPNFELGAHIIGFAGMDSQGLEGLERIFDKSLKTADTYVVLERDAVGRWIYIPEEKQGPQAPCNLHLTLDLRMQYIVERELKKGIQDLKAQGGMVVAMDPFTGKILAMAVHPSFNPNVFEEYTADRWRNRALTDPFEPGSLLKVFLLAAALKDGIVKEDDIFFCENGSYTTIGGQTIHDMKPHGWLSVRNILRVSSNIGASKLGARLGAKGFYHYLNAFGLNEKTGIDLLGEGTGDVRLPGSWTHGDLATISFGQGVSVTALQLVTALSCIANDGNLMKPYLVERITDERGRVVAEFFPQVRRRVLSKETCRRVTSVLKDVVKEGGTGNLAYLPGYEVAGKTGTAQKPDLSKGGYSEHKMIASFMGFIPADDPRVALLVLVDEPQISPYGGLAATPIFRRIVEELMRYMGVPPKTEALKTAFTIMQVPPPRKDRDEHERNISPHRMPDLHGLGIRESLIRLEGEKVHIRLVGSGILVNQSPNPGTTLHEGKEILLEFASTE